MSATCLATARLPANRLSAAEPTGSRSSPRGSGGADNDIAHLLMCIAMAGMLAPSVKTLPPHAWEAIFGLLTAWFAWRLVGDTKVNGVRSLVSGHRAAHLFHCAAMVYMFAALTTSDGMDMTGMGSGMARSLKYPALALAFAFVLVCYSVWDLLGQLSGRRYSLGVAPSAGAARDRRCLSRKPPSSRSRIWLDYSIQTGREAIPERSSWACCSSWSKYPGRSRTRPCMDRLLGILIAFGHALPVDLD